MAKDAVGTVREETPEGWKAVKMGKGVTAGDYFIIHPDQGGHYSDGEPEKVADWPVMSADHTETADAASE